MKLTTICLCFAFVLILLFSTFTYIPSAQAVPSIQINRASVDPNFPPGYLIDYGRPNWFDRIAFEFTATSSRQISSYLCGYKLIQNGAPSSSPLYPVLRDSDYQTCSSSGLRILNPQMLPNTRSAFGVYSLSNVPLPTNLYIQYKFCIKARDRDGTSTPGCWLWAPQMVKMPRVSGYSDADSVFSSGAVIISPNIQLNYEFQGRLFPGLPYFVCSYDQSFGLQPPTAGWTPCGSGQFVVQPIRDLSHGWHSVWVRAQLPNSYPGQPFAFIFCRSTPDTQDICRGQPPSSIPMSSRIGSGGGVPFTPKQIADKSGNFTGQDKEPMQPIPLPQKLGNFTAR